MTSCRPIFRVKQCKLHCNRYRFLVRARISGTWTRKYFEARKRAETYAELKNREATNQGREMAEFPTWLRVMAELCNRTLQPHGKTIQDATTHFLEFLKATQKSRTTPEVISELLAAKRAEGARRERAVSG